MSDEPTEDSATAATKAAAEAAQAAQDTATTVGAAKEASVEAVKTSASVSEATTHLNTGLGSGTGGADSATTERLQETAATAAAAAREVSEKTTLAKDQAEVAVREATEAVSKVTDAISGTRADASPKTVVATTVTTSYYDLLKSVVLDKELSSDDKREVLKALKGISPTSDRMTYRTAILLLGFIAALTVGAVWHLMANGATNVPDGLVAIASGAVGGLAGLLGPSRNSDSQAP